MGVFTLFSYSDSATWPQNCLREARRFAAHCGSFLLCGPWGAQPTLLCPHLSKFFLPTVLFIVWALGPWGAQPTMLCVLRLLYCPQLPTALPTKVSRQHFCTAAAFAERQQSLGKKCWQRERLCIIKQHELLHETAVLLNTVRYFIIYFHFAMKTTP